MLKMTCLLIPLGFILGCDFLPVHKVASSSQFETVTTQVIDYDLGKLVNLDTYGIDGATIDLEHSLLLVAYFNHSDCKSCVNRELGYFNALARANVDQFDFCVTTFNPAYTDLGDTYDLKRMKRVAQLDLPILLESVPGEAGFGERIVIALVETQNQKIICRYFPQTQIEGWQAFESQLVARWGFRHALNVDNAVKLSQKNKA